MTKRRLFGLLTGLVILAIVTIAFVPRADAAIVSRIVDGDTLVVEIDGREETIRLLNIDTPETKHPSKSKQCLGDEATQWLADRLPLGTKIDLAFDEEKTDRYGRLLAAVYENDSLVNAEIAHKGLGVPVTYGANSKFHDEIQGAHRAAKTAERGLFDPALDCTMPAKVEALEQLMQEISQLEPEEDPTTTLEDATVILEELQTTVAEFEPQSLGLNGMAIYSVHTLGAYTADLITAAEDIQDSAVSHTAKLRTAKAEWDAEQERLQKEEEEEERRRAEQQEKEQQAEVERQTEQERERQQQAQPQAPAQPQPTREAPAPAPEQQHQPTTPPVQEPVPQPTTPAAPAPKKKSSCTPYGPEIPYSNDGGYTGLRYGMPGGKTFRKCS